MCLVPPPPKLDNCAVYCIKIQKGGVRGGRGSHKSVLHHLQAVFDQIYSADSNLRRSQKQIGKALCRFIWGVRIQLSSSSAKTLQGAAIAETSAVVQDTVALPALMVKP